MSEGMAPSSDKIDFSGLVVDYFSRQLNDFLFPFFFLPYLLACTLSDAALCLGLNVHSSAELWKCWGFVSVLFLAGLFLFSLHTYVYK